MLRIINIEQFDFLNELRWSIVSKYLTIAAAFGMGFQLCCFPNKDIKYKIVNYISLTFLFFSAIWTDKKAIEKEVTFLCILLAWSIVSYYALIKNS